IATGSLEQPAVFRNNDLPGVMMGSAAQRLIRLYGVRPGRKAVVLTANADGYGVALDLADAGVEVGAIADLRPQPGDSATELAARRRGLEILPGHTVVEAVPGLGKQHVTGALVARVTGEGTFAAAATMVECDLVCMSTGYSPAGQLLRQAGA